MRPLNNPSFAFFFCARVASTLAFQMIGVAVGWQVYELTGSAVALGLIGLVQFLPTLTLVLYAGHVADRYDRRLVASLCQAAEGIGTAGIAAAVVLHALSPQLLFAMVLGIGILRAFEAPAQAAILPNIVPRDQLQTATANSTSALRLAQLAGPAIGGVLYLIGPVVVYATAAALVVTGALMLQFIRPAAVRVERPRLTLASLLAGVTFVRNDKIILGAISLDLFAVLMGGATALLPIYARDILATGPWGLGLLRAAPGCGAIVMTLVLAQRPLRRHCGPLLFASIAGYGLATIGFAFSASFVLSFAMLAASGLFDAISQVIRSTLVQLETPDDVRGRVTAVNLVFTQSSGQLGQVESGLVAAWLGPVASAAIGGIGTIAVALAYLGLFPEIARIDTLERADAGPVRKSPA